MGPRLLKLFCLLLVHAVWMAPCSGAQSQPDAGVAVPASASSIASDNPPVGAPATAPAADLIKPAVIPAGVRPAVQIPGTGVNWPNMFKQSMFFLGVEHGFRLLTEPGTRDGGFGLGSGYTRSVGNLHGWADGDPFMVNYVGHPMQGSVAGYIWLQNDPAYRNVEIGKDPRYWRSRLRATAFAWAYSEMFEIGPLSEASV